MTTFIYTLEDPDTGEIRYVGKTIQNLPSRLNTHIQASKRGEKRHVCKWIKGLLLSEKLPIISEIDRCEGEWTWVEKYWISQLKTWGMRLTNLTEGGETNPTLQSEASRAKRIASLTGRKRSVEEGKAISRGKKGVAVSSERRGRIKETVTNLQGKAVERVSEGVVIDRYTSIQEAHQKSGYTRRAIAKACRTGRPLYSHCWKFVIKSEDIV